MPPAGRTLKRILILASLFILCIAGFLFSLKLGSLKITPAQIFDAIFRASEGPHYQIIYNIRLPRTLVAACVGLCLSLSGCLLQGIMRNPLAAPHIIGISAGAGTCRCCYTDPLSGDILSSPSCGVYRSTDYGNHGISYSLAAGNQAFQAYPCRSGSILISGRYDNRTHDIFS